MRRRARTAPDRRFPRGSHAKAPPPLRREVPPLPPCGSRRWRARSLRDPPKIRFGRAPVRRERDIPPCESAPTPSLRRSPAAKGAAAHRTTAMTCACAASRIRPRPAPAEVLPLRRRSQCFRCVRTRRPVRRTRAGAGRVCRGSPQNISPRAACKRSPTRRRPRCRRKWQTAGARPLPARPNRYAARRTRRQAPRAQSRRK